MRMAHASTHQGAAASMYLGLLLMVMFRVTAVRCGAAKLAEFLPPSSRGLGRRPLTAETGVRIPVAVLRGPARERGFVVSGPEKATRRGGPRLGHRRGAFTTSLLGHLHAALV